MLLVNDAPVFHPISRSLLRTFLPSSVIVYILFFELFGVMHFNNPFSLSSPSALET